MDNRGYTNPEDGKKYYNEKRAAFANNPKHLLTYCAEYCFNAEEAFSLEGDNKFNKVAVAEQLAQIRLYKRGPRPIAGNLEYMYKNSQHTADNIDGVTFKPNKDSKLLMLEPPIWEMSAKYDEEGHVVFTPPADPINNLYVIGIDSIDIGARDTSAMTKDPSKFCAVVKKRAYGLENPKYVCMYMDRPSDIREAYKIAVKLAEWYKAPINIEATRMNMISWARDNKYLKHFMKRPSATFPDPTRRNINQYGSPATTAVIDHQTTLIADYVNDYYQEIWFEEMLDQLNRYSDDNKTKFDIIAAMGMAELADEELHDISPKSMKPREEVFQDIGYYIDEHGYKKYGVIPNNSMLYKPRVNDEWRSMQSDIRTSNPNLL